MKIRENLVAIKKRIASYKMRPLWNYVCILLLAIGSAPPLPLPTPSLPAQLPLFLMLQCSDEKYYMYILHTTRIIN